MFIGVKEMSGMKNLFDEIKIGNMKIKNRFVRSATWENMADEKGHLTDKLFKVYEDLAKGGVGLIITSYCYILKEEKPNAGMIGIYDDSFIQEYKELTEKIHEHGSKIVLQIVYGGSQTRYNTEERVIWGMSATKHKSTGVVPKEISKEEIEILKKAFADAAVRAKKAGFDGVQIHGAHGYFLSQSLSAYYNRRNDEYGGSIENRGRLIIEVYDKVREAVGREYPVMLKINSSDFSEGEATFEECKYVCKALEDKGIDAVEISGGGRIWATTIKEEGIYKDYAQEIAEIIDVPVILVGINRSLEFMNEILNSTKISLFSMSRPFLREPHLVNRWISGDKDKSKCISCGKCYSPEGNICVFNRK